MTLNLDVDYEKHLRSAKPVVVGQHSIRPKGALGAASIYPPQIIPPLNTSIQFDLLPEYKLSEHPGLAALDTPLPLNFNWRTDGKEKSALMSKPGNQLLCGSCWAISAAGIVADNHVVSGTVDWIPNLSTTWCLAAYPQHQCQGGNPAKLYQDISENGISTAHCIDYSWCSENSSCNGKATAHFEKANANLSELIPNPGCYDSSVPHYLYYIDPPQTVSLQASKMDPDTFANTIKKHIFYHGPVQGGFLVFKNFRTGAFSKLNGGLYLETCNYDSGDIKFDETQIDPSNYIGSHAIAIIGWGIQKDVIIDNTGTKKDIPYWYCRNSWGEKWADDGYFKMPMYPYNKLSQFDNVVQIKTPKGINVPGGGIVMLTASKPPVSMTLNQIDNKFSEITKSKPNEYYSQEKKDKGIQSAPDPNPNTNPTQEATSSIWKYIRLGLFVVFSIIIIILIFFAIKYLYKQITKKPETSIAPATLVPAAQPVTPLVTVTQPVTPLVPVPQQLLAQQLLVHRQPAQQPLATTPQQPVSAVQAAPRQPQQLLVHRQPAQQPLATTSQQPVSASPQPVQPLVHVPQPAAAEPQPLVHAPQPVSGQLEQQPFATPRSLAITQPDLKPGSDNKYTFQISNNCKPS